MIQVKFPRYNVKIQGTSMIKDPWLTLCLLTAKPGFALTDLRETRVHFAATKRPWKV